MTQMLPSSVVIQQSDVQAAAHEGLITASQAQALWHRWQDLQPLGVGAGSAPARPLSQIATGSQFGMVHVLYYFGGMVAIGAMTLFMTLGFQAMGPAGLLLISAAYFYACLKVADHLVRQSLPVPAGILATLAICLVPLAVWSLQSVLGLWPVAPAGGATDSYTGYHRFVNWRWMTLEFTTLAAGVAMLWRYRLPFMVMPLAVTVWYMSMDVAHALMQPTGWDWQFTRDVSLVFGLGTCAVAAWVDVRSRRSNAMEWQQDFAFWLYLFGAIMFWVGLSVRDAHSEWSKLGYAGINLVLVLLGAAIGRRIFTILGALGVAGYLGYLSHQLFKDSLLFPFALTLLGLGVVYLGVWWQRNQVRIQNQLQAFLPAALRQI
jgi:hypothetical protein